MEELTLTKDESIDIVQLALSKLEHVDCPVTHRFLKGVYIRMIYMPAKTVNSAGEIVETVVVSKVHRTEHPFVVVEGKVAVYNKIDEFLGLIEAPYVGLTPQGTRRILHIVEPCRWLTIHRLPYITGDEGNLSEKELNMFIDRVENDLVETREIKLMEQEVIQ